MKETSVSEFSKSDEDYNNKLSEMKKKTFLSIRVNDDDSNVLESKPDKVFDSIVCKINSRSRTPTIEEYKKNLNSKVFNKDIKKLTEPNY